jgi:ElaB/YqjD/DUF883 family membrane-anchored ribosome-binding protein
MGAGSSHLDSGETNDYRREPGISDIVENARREALERAQDDGNPEAIRREIETTRADLSETVEAIQQKLDPQRIREEAVSTVRDATVGRVEDMADEAKWKVKGASYNVIETIKRNPVPAALMAVGLGWLVMESRNTAQSYDYQGRYYEGRRYQGSSFRGGRYAGERNYEARSGDYPARGAYDYYEGTEPQRGRLHEAAQGAREVASDVGDKAGEAVDQARRQVENLAERTRDQAEHVADEAQWRAQQVKSRFSETMDENPLLIALGAAALGALVGFALPSTEKEGELFGEARDSLMEKAQETASETVQKVQRVAAEAGQAAKEAAKGEAEKQDLTGKK